VATVAAAAAVGATVIAWRRRQGAGDPGPPTAVVDHWYSHAVGHVIEALRRCQGYHACDPELRLSLVLNGASPLELVGCVPFVERVFGVPYTSFGAPQGSPRKALRGVPRDWDYVLRHPAATDPEQARFDGLRRYHDASARHFRARIAVGVAGRTPPAYEPHQHLKLDLPEPARERARAELGGVQAIAVMPAGSGARYLYPSLASWMLILDELERRLPDTAFAFLGRLRSRDGRTVSGIERGEVDRLVAARGNGIDAFDRPLLDQLAIVETARLFVSPHTGFGFAAVAVETPWLTLSGGDWHEYFFNGVPFHSVLPKSRDYPAFVRGGPLPMIDADEDGEGRRSAAMSLGRVREDLDEFGDAAVALVEGRVSYEEALATYFPRLLEAYEGDRSKIASFEDVHVGFL
jgi:hypothetical protein